MGMPTYVSGLEAMGDDRAAEDVLDKFISCHEQTYEEFLSTFTHLSKEDNVTYRGATGTDYSENLFSKRKSTRENEPDDRHLRNETSFLHTTAPGSEDEQIPMDEGQKVGGSLQGDMSRAGKIMVDNFLGLEDLDVDEEIKSQMSQDVPLLPGEVEQDLCPSAPSYSPSRKRPLAPGVKPRPPASGTPVQKEQTLGDEVQPFSLDEEFDYDNVVLTPKFTPEELRALREQPERERENASPDLAAPPDSLPEAI